MSNDRAIAGGYVSHINEINSISIFRSVGFLETQEADKVKNKFGHEEYVDETDKKKRNLDRLSAARQPFKFIHKERT